MNIQKFIFYILTFTCIANVQVVYTKEQQDDNKKSDSVVEFEDSNIQKNSTSELDEKSFYKFIDEIFQTASDQTQRIEFCLQSIEQIINAGKLKINTQKISKNQLLQEIKCLKQNIDNICQYFSQNFPKKESIFLITSCNTVFISYLLPAIQNDITTINVDNFQEYLEKNMGATGNKLTDFEQLAIMLDTNEKDLQALMTATDLIGFSILNRIYHYLDTTPLPWYGRSTTTAAKDLALWGSAAALIYTIGIYSLPKDLPIPGTWKEYRDVFKKGGQANDPELLKEYKAWKKENIEIIDGEQYNTAKRPDKFNALQRYETHRVKEKAEIRTWSNDNKTYTNWTIADLPAKSVESRIPYLPFHVGDAHDVEQLKQPMALEERKNIYNNFGVYSYIHDGLNTYTNPFMIFAGGILTWLIKKPALEAFESAKKNLNYGFNYYIKGDITPPKHAADMTKVYFKDMIGSEHLEREAQLITDYLKNPTRYERQGNGPSTGYLLIGPSQTGKSFFAKALKTMVDDAFDGTSEKVKFAVITTDDVRYGFTDIFYWARKHAPIILFMDEIDMFGTRRDRNEKNTQELLTAMNGMETDPSKKVIVIAATNKPEELDFALKQKGRLGTVLTFDVPTYKCRKAYLEKQLSKKNINLNPAIIETIAQETDGQTYNMIDDIIRQALQLATFKKQPVTEDDFENTLDREIRKIKANTIISPSEKELVAIYQAGQGAARHVLKTDQQIVKITINAVDKPLKSKEGFGVIQEQKGEMHENNELLPQTRIKPTRLGFVFTMSKTDNHELVSDEEQEKELIALLAGQAALELIKGTTYSGFGKEDRAKVIEVLEKRISQGTPITNAIRQQALTIKEELYQKAKTTLQSHLPFIQIIMNELLKNNTINTKQWLAISANYKI